MLDKALVQKLIAEQFPQWKHLAIEPIIPGGWDNRSFRLGQSMLVRLPSSGTYAPQVSKEQEWLPKLALKLDVKIPQPVALGQPSEDFPFPWSIYRWIDGSILAEETSFDQSVLAMQLGTFLNNLQKIDVTNGPLPGEHNFHRAGDLSVYTDQVLQAIKRLQGKVDTKKAGLIWQSAISTQWQRKSVWVHGDISAGNLLVAENQLIAVIDFGCCATGDPACDLAMAWSYFDEENRAIFKNTLTLDGETWLRGSAWALWKALIVLSELIPAPVIQTRESLQVLQALDCCYKHK